MYSVPDGLTILYCTVGIDDPDADGEVSCTRAVVGRSWFSDWQMPRGRGWTDTAAHRSWYDKVMSLLSSSLYI